jgi:hypothetical protein
MAISQFPPASTSGEPTQNDFILNKNNTNNQTFVLPRTFAAGGYALVTSSNDSSFDVYLINELGSAVGYTNGSAIVADEAFDTVVLYGVGTAETVQFSYRGPSTNATAVNNETGAGPFLTSITPADLPNIDDTATVAGGNFASNVQITFESGTVVKNAKNVVVGSSTALVVTRPDDLIEDLAPYNLRAVNPDATSPTGSNVNILTGTVTAGTDPSFVTGALIEGANPGTAFSTSILVSDSDGTVVNWAITAGTIPPGLSLATATGAISGTPTTAGDYYFTVQITDDGQNTNSREFNLPVGFIATGANSTVVGGTTYVWWTASGTAIYKNVTGSKSLPYVVVAGGGSGGRGGGGQSGGGGGAGGLLFGTATITTAATATITVGAGGASTGASYVSGNNGSNSIFSTIGTAFGGGGGGFRDGSIIDDRGKNGGSGGGAPTGGQPAGNGTAGQGNNGGPSGPGGGGGYAGTGTISNGGAGGDFGAWASAINIIYSGGFFAGGGGGGASGTGGVGGGGNGQANGSVNSGGGGGGSSSTAQGSGGSGLVMVRFS